jgi:hypothetical protein
MNKGGIKKKFQIKALKIDAIRTVCISNIRANKETTINNTNAGTRYPKIGTA